MHLDRAKKETLTLIPMAFETSTHITGIIAVNSTQNKTTINTMSRQEILETTNGNLFQKLSFANWMFRFDNRLFGNPSQELKDAICSYTDITSNMPPPLSPPPCEWHLVEFCQDNFEQLNWFGGYAPSDYPDGDYDKDGIPNKLDPDWLSWITQYGDHDKDGIPNNKDNDWLPWFIKNGDHDNDGIANADDQDWQDFVLHHPNIKWEDALDRIFGKLDWDNFDITFDADDLDFDFDTDDDLEGQTFAEFWKDITDIFDYFFPDKYDFPDDGENHENDPPCWDGDSPNPIGTTSKLPIAKGREGDVYCEWFYILDCGGIGFSNAGEGWWKNFTQVALCPTCSEQSLENEQQEKYTRISGFLAKYNIKDTQSNIDLLMNSSCSAFTPPNVFDECLKSKYIQSLATKLNISIIDATELFSQHQNFLIDNQDYESAYLAADFPEVGSIEWANVVEKNIGFPSGTIILNDFSDADLQQFRIIPESSPALITPLNGVTYDCDGFYYKFQPCDPSRHWFKISATGTVSISKLPDGTWSTKTDWSAFARIAALVSGKPFAVDWQPKTAPHNTSNPFCP